MKICNLKETFCKYIFFRHLSSISWETGTSRCLKGGWGATKTQSQHWQVCRQRKMANGMCAGVLNISQAYACCSIHLACASGHDTETSSHPNKQLLIKSIYLKEWQKYTILMLSNVLLLWDIRQMTYSRTADFIEGETICLDPFVANLVLDIRRTLLIIFAHF